MSRSSPGRYAAHEFAKNVYNVRAQDGAGRPIRVVRASPQQWTVTGHNGTVRVSYTLFADRADGTYSGIDRTHAHLNIPATLMWARGLERRPATVRFTDLPAGWAVATQLRPGPDSLTFSAPNLQLLMDAPVEVSDHDLRTWTVSSGGREQTIRLAIHHTGTRQEVDRYVDQIGKVVLEQEAVFGELPAFDHGVYTFLADYLPHASGDGMEHRNSTVLTSTGALATAMPGLLGTVSHEFFHAWNVERIRPRALEPFSFLDANLTGELWLAEGVTSYYGPLTIHRAGLSSLETFARGLGFGVNTVLNAPGRRIHSAREMSMMAPFVDAATSIDPTNFANTFIS
jgi:predicted metalloprotease with PDZ domain